MPAIRSSVGAHSHESSVTGATEVVTAAATENEGTETTSVVSGAGVELLSFLFMH